MSPEVAYVNENYVPKQMVLSNCGDPLSAVQSLNCPQRCKGPCHSGHVLRERWQVPSDRVWADDTSAVRSWDHHGRGCPRPLPSLAGTVFLRKK